MKYTPYQAGYAHFMEVLTNNLNKKGVRYNKEFDALKFESISHINSDRELRANGVPWPDKVGDLFVFKGTVEKYVTYLVVIDEKDSSKNKVYIVNEENDGIAPTAEEMTCFEDIRKMAGVWKDDIMARLSTTIQYGWVGFFYDEVVDDKEEVTRTNMLASQTLFCEDEDKTMVKTGVHLVGQDYVVAIASGNQYKRFNFTYDPRDSDDFDNSMESLGAMLGDYNSELTEIDQDNYYQGLENWFEYSVGGDSHTYRGAVNDLFKWSVEAMGSKVKLLCVVTDN